MTASEATNLVRLRWSLAIQEYKVADSIEAIISAYSEPSRAYHNAVHIATMMQFIQEHIPDEELLPALDLATIYHDLVYDPKSSTNEEDSADLAMKDLGQTPLATRVTELILSTKRHAPADDTFESALFVDADLAILGQSSAEYDEYSAAIRNEYDFVADDDYRKGRTEVLERFLLRETIFTTAAFRERFEQSARRNLRREIELLRAPSIDG
ncbi:MAG: hypothetical protein JST51_16090 [Armatimonadetes bacterium]|nr:hypothetical protein [Armatimonadota bacterium]